MSAVCQEFHSKTHITGRCETPAFAILCEDFLKCDKFADFFREEATRHSVCIVVIHLSLGLFSCLLILAAQSRRKSTTIDWCICSLVSHLDYCGSLIAHLQLWVHICELLRALAA